MRILISLFLCILSFSQSAFAMLSMELTQGMSGAVPIAVVPFAIQGQTPPQDISAIIANDLRNCGRFKVLDKNQLTQFPASITEVSFDYFKKTGVDNVVIGKIEQLDNRYVVKVQLIDITKGKDPLSTPGAVLFEQKFSVYPTELRAVAHHISDEIYQTITGVRGVFSTRLAYVVQRQTEKNSPRYFLEVSDQDGYNPRPLLSSNDPIMSPAWSPNGKQIAYVSFEHKQSAIYIEDVSTGQRSKVSEFPGINGAPAFSPDGKKLALVLSKSGSPNIYILELASRQLTQLTNDFYINTEPTWSPHNDRIAFTSNRSGSPQIYQIDLQSRAITRLTYDGKYNARASFAEDGNHLLVLNQDGGLYNVGFLDLDTGSFRILTHFNADSESPSIAPNGTMALFGMFYRGKNVLGMASVDGRIQIRLPALDGEVEDPAWSPFLS